VIGAPFFPSNRNDRYRKDARMDVELEGKVALVTGASRGIGRAIAQALAARGAAVVVHCHREHAAAEEVVAAIAEAGGRAVTAQGDVALAAEVHALFDAAESAFHGLDIVVNNAAIVAAGPVASIDEATFDRLVAVNLKSVWLSGRQAAQRLPDGGRIINLAALIPAPKAGIIGAYAATKAGVEALTRGLAAELGPRGITVNAVSPGPTDTDMLLPEARAQLEGILDATPLRRLGQPADVAEVVAFLAGERARWITGQTIRATGGMA
jgi:3-oxoacyl-[acyl-carrier protein] reductase